MTTSPRYHKWFDLGAKNFRGWADAVQSAPHLPADEPLYPCPLCTRLLTKDDLLADLLTAEDVPPKSVGGKKMILTCQPCNHDQGSKIDSRLPKREHHIDLETGARTVPRKKNDIYYPTIDGEQIAGPYTNRGRLWIAPGGLGFEYVPEWNNPDHYAEYLEAARVTPWRFRFKPGYSCAMADLSRIRAAYLASFALFGWAHILRPTYRYIREQLATATASDDLLALAFYDPEISTTENVLMVVQEDGPLKGLIWCQMARSLVFLPGPGDDRPLNEVGPCVEAWKADGGPPLSCALFEWPTRPRHFCDRYPDRAPVGP